MRTVAIIPARLAATRFPNKLLKLLDAHSVIVHTYYNAVVSGLFDQVIVATDSDLIREEIENYGGKVVMTGEHETGSDRIAEAAKKISADIIVNIQGDEPFLVKEPLKELISVFEQDEDQEIDVASLYLTLTDKEEIENPNNVKLVCDRNQNALYFSRFPIPFSRDGSAPVEYKKHIGVYAFRKKALEKFSALPVGIIEGAEKIEAIRFLENHMKIRMVRTHFVGIGIDTPEDLHKAQQIIKQSPHLNNDLMKIKSR